jgi:malate dehydrogenase
MRHSMVKVAIIGAGFVGATAAYAFAMRKLVDEIALVDVKPGLARGKALDISHAVSVFGIPVKLHGGEEYSLISGAEVVVITAGIPRQPHQKREETLHTNANIMKKVIAEVKHHAPESILLVVTNPLDAMTWLAAETSGFEKRRVIGMAGTLDTARFKAFIAEELDADPATIEAFVLGGHGDLMVPLTRLATVSGKPLTRLLGVEELTEIEERTRHGGGEIVNLMGQSAYYGPAAAIFEVTEAIVKGSKQPVPASVWLDGEYGLKGLFLGVPCLLSRKGVEKVVELRLEKKELEALQKSAEHVRKLTAELK